MQVLIIIGSVIAALVALVLIVALIVPKKYTIESEIIINKPRTFVFDYIKHLKNQEQFSKWVMLDPNLKTKTTGTDGQVGFIYAWEGNKRAGMGEQEIKAIDEGKRIDVEVRFLKPFAGVANTPFSTIALNDHQTTVRWGMNGSTPYPMNLMSLMMSGMLKKDLAISLNNLKQILENN